MVADVMQLTFAVAAEARSRGAVRHSNLPVSTPTNGLSAASETSEKGDEGMVSCHVSIWDAGFRTRADRSGNIE